MGKKQNQGEIRSMKRKHQHKRSFRRKEITESFKKTTNVLRNNENKFPRIKERSQDLSGSRAKHMRKELIPINIRCESENV